MADLRVEGMMFFPSSARVRSGDRARNNRSDLTGSDLTGSDLNDSDLASRDLTDSISI